jgi:hypothetical protein
VGLPRGVALGDLFEVVFETQSDFPRLLAQSLFALGLEMNCDGGRAALYRSVGRFRPALGVLVCEVLQVGLDCLSPALGLAGEFRDRLPR